MSAEHNRPSGNPPMTRSEREDLAKIVRKRERLLRLKAGQRKAELLADFEAQIATIWKYDRNEVWRASVEKATQAAAEAQAAIAAECGRLGIPREFQPSIACDWYSRGENASKRRRDELRKVAVTRLNEMEKTAIVAIEADSLRLQTELIAHGLGSPLAKAFLESLAPVEQAMPRLDIADFQKLLPRPGDGE